MDDLISRAAALLPCPFCGGEAMIQHQLAGYCGARVSCVECDAETGGYAVKGDNDAADARAVTAWNTRSLPDVDDSQTSYLAVKVGSCQRIAAYLARRLKSKQTDYEDIHGYDAGCETEVMLLASDLEALIASDALPAVAASQTADPVVKADSCQPEQMYLICKYGGYYRPNCRGYTSSIDEAGRYTLAEAEKETHPNGADGPRDGMTYIPAPPVKADSCQRVTVKPLVWFEVERGTNGYGKWEAQGYTVRKIEGIFLLDFAGDGKSTWRFITSDAAKAAAQADYEARILAAIDTHSDPQCCMCGKLGLSTAEDGGPECELHDGRWVCSSDCWNNASALAEATPPQPDPRDALIARLVEASEALRQDMMERARCGMDVIYGTEYRIVNAGRTAWDDFCDAIAAAKGGAA